MNPEQLLSLVRTVLKFAGGFVASKGWAESSAIEAVIGGVLALIGIFWSFKQHQPAEDK